MARTTRSDWLDAGLALLRDGGEQEVTIDRLCTRLSRTKGAFYHHFDDAGAYLEALLEHWAARQTAAPIAESRSGRNPHERRQRLEQSVRGLDMALERAIRSWALREARAARVLRRVDARRIGHLASLYRGEGVCTAWARVLARVEYAAFVGAQQLFPDLSAAPAREVEGALNRALVLLVRHGPGEPRE